MKADVQAYAQSATLNKCVITVPANFSEAQRAATKEAAKLADLDLLQMINEPTAAAIAYGCSKTEAKDQTILIFDYGGGTFDCTILEVKDHTFYVKASEGDPKLGGRDIDQAIVDHFTKMILEENEFDITQNTKAKAKMYKACEDAKITLTAAQSTEVVCDALYTDGDGETMDFSQQLTRATFEELNRKHFEKAISIVKKTLE